MDEKIDPAKVAQWLNEKWKGPKVCPICNSNSWGISGRPIEVREFHGGSLVVGGPVYPLITLTCGVCGYTLLFNAISTGLVEAKQKQATPPTDAEQSEEKRRRKL